MGFDCGFDIHPCLDLNTENKQTYERFINEIINTYDSVYDHEGRCDDGKLLELDANNIRFMIGECPTVPENPDRCDLFLRFSSKVSGHLTRQAEPYIKAVCRMARRHCGDRVHSWHELNETDDEQQWGFYSWKEVHEANEKLREREAENKTGA